MQVMSPEEEVIFSKMFETKDQMEAARESMQAQEEFKDCTFHTSALPVVGEVVEIKGLRFRCSNVSVKKGYVGFHIL
jgi:hypothetical protein